MKKKYYQIGVMIFLALITVSATLSQSNIVKLPASAGQAPEIKIVESTKSAIRYQVSIPAYERLAIRMNATEFDRIDIPGFGRLGEPGKPDVPVLGKMIALPGDGELEVQVEKLRYIEIENVYIAPAQPPARDDWRSDQYQLDSQLYQQDQYYPSSLGWAEDVKIMRGYPLTIFWISPVQFNPVQRTARIFYEFELVLSFDSDSELVIDPRLSSPIFDSLLGSIVQNWNMISKISSRQQPQSEQEFDFFTGCDYLIITHRIFSAAADSLAMWRKYNGFKTRIAYVEEIGSSAEEIRRYIQSAYDNWNPVPSFVVFLGDAEFVPTNYFTLHNEEENGYIGTDLYYATTDGSDYFPDIITGRIPVDTRLEALSFVSKVINYERNPVADVSFYQTAAVAAYFQDEDDSASQRDGYEDRRFVLTSEEIRDFLMSQNYAVERIYYAKPEVNPTNYNRDYYGNGARLPDDLLRDNGFTWTGNANDISRRIEQGCFLLSHRDHGSRDGWGDPSYRNNDVSRLFNRSKLPVVLSINCETGWFDNETDDAISGTNPNSESFAERWLKNYNGGAVGVFAPTRISYSGYNDILAKGIIDAIWPEFLPHRGQNFPTYILGQALNYGKMVMATEYSANKTRQIQFEEFHYFGDPATTIWTRFPQDIQIVAVDSVFINQLRLSVQTDVAQASIALLQSGELLSSALTDANGVAELQFAPVQKQDNLLLVVKKENHRIQTKRFEVHPARGLPLVINELDILDEDDNNQINIGETIYWKLKISNIGKIDQTDIRLELLCVDEMIDLIQPLTSIDEIRAGHQAVSSELSFQVRNNCPDGKLIAMDLRLTATTETLNFPLDFSVHEGTAFIDVQPKIVAHRVTSVDDSVVTSLSVQNQGFGQLNFQIRDQGRQLVTIGDTLREWWASSSGGTGNVFQAKKQVNLMRFNFFMKVVTPITAHFFVYEGNQLTGNYFKKAEFSRQISAPGTGNYWTGFLNVELVDGKYYYLGVSWQEGQAFVGRSYDSLPVEFPFANLQTGVVNLGGAPPADSVQQTISRALGFTQQVELGQGTWLEIPYINEKLLPLEAFDFELKLKNPSAEGTLFKQILITSNDPVRDSIRVPVYFTAGDDSFNLAMNFIGISDPSGNNNGIPNIGEEFALDFVAKNLGNNPIDAISFELMASDNNIEIADDVLFIEELLPETDCRISGFRIMVSPFCPPDYQFPFQIKCSASTGRENSFDFSLTVREGKPMLTVPLDSIQCTIDDYMDSCNAIIPIANSGFGRLIYQIENPVWQQISIATPKPNYWLPFHQGVGNIFFQINSEQLQSFSSFFHVNTPGSIFFFIYEGDSTHGKFDLKFSRKLDVEQTGDIWLTVPVQNCTLRAGHFYYFGNSWEGDIKISRANESYSLNSAAGIVLASAFNTGGFPPQQQVEVVRHSPLLIPQEYIYGVGSWLQFSASSDTLFPAEHKNVAIKLIASEPDTVLSTNIVIASNDPHHWRKLIPVIVNSRGQALAVVDEHHRIDATFSLNQNYPNPFNPTTNIQFYIDKGGDYELIIYNIAGQKVKTLKAERMIQGNYSVAWNGSDDFGYSAASGIYFLVLKSANYQLRRKILLIK